MGGTTSGDTAQGFESVSRGQLEKLTSGELMVIATEILSLLQFLTVPIPLGDLWALESMPASNNDTRKG